MSITTATTRNGVDTDKMFATLDLIKAQPELAAFQFRASNRWINGSHNRSTIQNFYAAGGEEASNAASVSIEPGQHRHDFFLVTQSEVFAGLRERGFNAVLQHPCAADDGSLSVHCKRLEIPYVNVEARFEAADAQTRMLRVALDVIQRGSTSSDALD